MSKYDMDEMEQAARAIATQWLTLVDCGVPPDHATNIVIGTVTGSRPKESEGLTQLLQMAVPQ